MWLLLMCGVFGLFVVCVFVVLFRQVLKQLVFLDMRPMCASHGCALDMCCGCCRKIVTVFLNRKICLILNN